MERLCDARDGHAVRTTEAYAAAQAAFLAKLVDRAPFESPDVPVAFVGGGFWKVWCRHCGNAPNVLVSAAVAYCFGCGARFAAVVLPADVRTIEQLLLERLPANRHWWPTESVDDVRAANAAHGGKAVA